jgi:hypothetical protein
MRSLSLVLCLLGLVALSSALPIGFPSLPDVEKKLHDEFVTWKQKFNKAYDGLEHLHRFTVWRDNLARIAAHNEAFHKGEETFWMGVNKFADMKPEEFKAIQGYKDHKKLGAPPPPPGPKPGKMCTHRGLVANETVDWRVLGGVTHVKDQGQCGSCWSFSTTGAVEGAWFVAGNPLVALSEEELVQCDTGADEGCDGGLMDNAFEFIMKIGGITSEELYPYVSGNGTTGSCKARLVKTKIAHISDFCDLMPKNETDLELALNQQPVAVAIEADQGAFQFYEGGVIPAKKCGTSLDHGVLAVGYGYDAKHKMKYWTVKNSWGPNWGEDGYVRIQKAPKKGHSACGIAEDASYPVV